MVDRGILCLRSRNRRTDQEVREAGTSGFVHDERKEPYSVQCESRACESKNKTGCVEESPLSRFGGLAGKKRQARGLSVQQQEKLVGGTDELRLK